MSAAPAPRLGGSARATVSRPAQMSCSSVSASPPATAGLITAPVAVPTRRLPPDQPARIHRARAVVGERIGEADGDLGRQLGLLRPLDGTAAARLPRPGRRGEGRCRPAAPHEAERIAELERLEHQERQRLERVARRHHAVDEVAVDRAVEVADRRGGGAVVGEDLRDQRVGAGGAPRRPFSQWPVSQLAPSDQTSASSGKGRIGPRVPGPQMDARRVAPCARHRRRRPGCRPATCPGSSGSQ